MTAAARRFADKGTTVAEITVSMDVKEEYVHVYCKQRLGGLTGMLYHLADLDAVIALCRLEAASMKASPLVSVQKQKIHRLPQRLHLYRQGALSMCQDLRQ